MPPADKLSHVRPFSHITEGVVSHSASLGQIPFTDNTKRAILCNLRYDQLRRDVLRRKDWNFARKRVQLPAASTPPAWRRFIA